MKQSGLSRRLVLGGAVVLAGGSTNAEAFTPQRTTFQSAIDAAAEAAVQAGACPGLCVAISRDGASMADSGYGSANLETETPVTRDSVFRIGSITKQFAAACVVRLAAEGRVDLDKAASVYLPAFATLAPFSLRELMNHTAGLSDGQETTCLATAGEARSQLALASEIAAQGNPFDFAPGTAWLYSNANYIVLGAVIEQVTGTPLAEAMRRMIFAPLALTSAAFDMAGAVVPGRASGYTPGDKAADFVNAAYIEIADTGAAGAMRATAPDLVRWHEALFSGALFEHRWVEEMLTPGRLRDGRVSGANRFSPNDASYGDVQYGMGLLLPPAEARGRSALHYGYINGFSACLETWIDHGITMAVLCNGDVGPHLPFRAVRAAINASLDA